MNISETALNKLEDYFVSVDKASNLVYEMAETYEVSDDDKTKIIDSIVSSSIRFAGILITLGFTDDEIAKFLKDVDRRRTKKRSK